MTEWRVSRCETDAAGFVLAGGASSRMGRDKALLEFAGQPLITYALSILREAGISAAIAGASASACLPLSTYALIVPDLEPGLGPLAGICAALASTSAHRAVFLSVDLPLLPSSLIGYLMHHAVVTRQPVTVASVNGFAETFPAVVDRSALPALQAELDAGRRGCFSAFRTAAAGLAQQIGIVAVELLVQTGRVAHPLALPPISWFLNLNTPDDLTRAERHLGRDIA